jgi:hypothetical protein
MRYGWDNDEYWAQQNYEELVIWYMTNKEKVNDDPPSISEIEIGRLFSVNRYFGNEKERGEYNRFCETWEKIKKDKGITYAFELKNKTTE